MRKFLRIGKIISLHGIKGEVKIFPTTDDIKRFDYLKNFYMSNDENADDFENADSYNSLGAKYIKNTIILKIEGYNSIEDSTKLIGKNLYVKREDAVKLESNEFYIVDLIGINAFCNGDNIGKVNDVLKTKANDILVVKNGKKEILIPFVSDFIDSITLRDERINIKTIEGLIW